MRSQHFEMFFSTHNYLAGATTKPYRILFHSNVRETLARLRNRTGFYFAVNARESSETRAIKCVEFVVRTFGTVHAAPLSATYWN